MLKEFKEFAMRGNVLDMAIGVVIGGAFGAIITALVENVIMPLVGGLTAGVNLDHLAVTIGSVDMVYGTVLSAIIKFIIIAFVIFLIVKTMNKMKKPVEEVVTTKTCPFCKSEVPLEATRCAFCTSELK